MRLMSAYGEKRKLDEDDELEGKAASAGGPGGLSKVSYTLQRQTIFNISLLKLCSPRPAGGSAGGLRRRVLINNVLHRIQDELRAEGSQRPLLLPPPPPPDDPADEAFGVLVAAQAPPHSMGPPLSPHPMAPPPSVPLIAPGLTPASLLEEDGAPSPPTPPRSSTPSPPSRTAAANTTTRTTSPAPPRDCRTTWARTESVFPVDAPSSPPLSDLALDDVLFADIDTSMYDFDPCTAAGGPGGSLKDDLLKSLVAPFSGPAPPAPPSSASQPFKIDLTELDHIMEVLVGS